MKTKDKLFNKYDAAILVFFLFIGLAAVALPFASGLINRTESFALEAVVTANGAVAAELPVGQGDLADNFNQLFEIITDMGYNIIEVRDGGVYMTEADCPDKYCVSQGRISEIGQVIVCLPNKVIVEIRSKAGACGKFDAMTK